MTSFPRKLKGLRFALAVVGVSYPFLVYFGLKHYDAAVGGVLLVGLIFARLLLAKGAGKPKYEYVILAASLALFVVILPIDGKLALLIYPLTISFGLAAAFTISLLRPPNIIESFARMVTPDLNAAGVAYTRKVALVWIAFFVINCIVSGATAIWGDMEIWVLYNGFISYLLIGALLVGEFVVRQFVKKHHVAVQ